MVDRERETTREKLSEELKPTLDKEQLRDIDPSKEHKDQVRGGGTWCRLTR